MFQLSNRSRRNYITRPPNQLVAWRELLLEELQIGDVAADRFGFRFGYALAREHFVDRIAKVVLRQYAAGLAESRIEIVDPSAIGDGIVVTDEDGGRGDFGAGGFDDRMVAV